MKSLNHAVSSFKPSVFCLQETKLRTTGKIKGADLSKYVIFELVRKESRGGGLAIGALDDLEPRWVSEGDDVEEVIVIEVKINDLQVRILCGYGPQETDLLRKDRFWARVAAEVNSAAEAGTEIIIMMDGNLHAGDSIIPGDPNNMNDNGRRFQQFLNNNSQLSLLNGSDICDGTITRSRNKNGKLEQAVLDI